jgi:ABC-type dipeptide/oligopeptide/nickel transport system ATPase component
MIQLLRIVERAEIRPILHTPLHPYTEALLAANPNNATEPNTGVLHSFRYGAEGDWAPGVDFAGYGPLSHQFAGCKARRAERASDGCKRHLPRRDDGVLDLRQCWDRRAARCTADGLARRGELP